jgi:hypothetical protein
VGLQSVEWTDDNVPEILVNANGDAQFFDRPDWYAFAIGDQIIHFSEIGPSVYRIIDVQSEFDPSKDYYADVPYQYRRVTIRGV